jgi:hypothetical protein
MLCECGDPGCNELFLVGVEEYRRARRRAPFLIAPDHDG